MFRQTILTVFVLTVIATVVCSVNVAESQEYVTDGLIGFWTMDKEDIQGDLVKDVSGKKNHGQIGGAPKVVPGKIAEYPAWPTVE